MERGDWLKIVQSIHRHHLSVRKAHPLSSNEGIASLDLAKIIADRLRESKDPITISSFVFIDILQSRHIKQEKGELAFIAVFQILRVGGISVVDTNHQIAEFLEELNSIFSLVGDEQLHSFRIFIEDELRDLIP